MQTLYHHPSCPLSKQIRIYLKEFEVEFSMIKEDYWHKRQEFLLVNPASTLPVLTIDKPQCTMIGVNSIVEYMIETYDEFFLMPKDPVKRTAIRNYIDWFNSKFYREVSKILIDEKIIRLLMKSGQPRSNFIIAAKSNLRNHLTFLTNLLKEYSYIGSDKLSIADIAAAAHLSIVDYFGEINWNSWPLVKEWYAIIKSRPSFQPILHDSIPGFTPSKSYKNLDF